jgi:hypothetical protein
MGEGNHVGPTSHPGAYRTHRIHNTPQAVHSLSTKTMTHFPYLS